MLSFFCRRLLFAAVLLLLCQSGTAADNEAMPSLSVQEVDENMFRFSASDFKMIRADHWSITGDNLVVEGNVFVPSDVYDIYADRVVINVKSRDFDARGNLRLYQKNKSSKSVKPGELAQFEDVSGILYQIGSVTRDIFGRQTVQVEYYTVGASMQAESLSGNLTTGYFQFTNALLMTPDMSARIKSGRRLANGILKVEDATISTCPYIESDNAHYAIHCKNAEIRPYNTDITGTDRIQRDYNEYSLTATNCTVQVYGVPLLWIPYIYKPRTETLGLFQIQFGDNSTYGYYLSLSKKYQLLDYPDAWIRVRTDFLEKRGVGAGVVGGVSFENSRTEYSFYNIYDRNPEYDRDDLAQHGIALPHYRYDFRISNVTHLTPTLDFRGHFEYMSDEYFNDDFASGYYSSNPRPVTFAALEQQFEHFTASIYFRPHINRFFTEVEQLPVFRFDVPRQEIFDTNFYYQSETSIGYFQRRWRTFNDSEEYEQPYEYHAARFDTVHFLYYPLQLDFLTIVPRAGIRMTAYSNSSEQEIDDDDLYALLASSNPSYSEKHVYDRDYDNAGGSRVRFVGEFGVQMRTKISNTWQDVRSYWLNLDGLRHVMIPYVDYTFIPKPSVDKENLYYFDDTDLIEEQNFVRFGLINRLQTRQGDRLVNYFTMENYWDLFMTHKGDYGNVGDFCTKITMTPIRGLTLSAFFAVSPSDARLDDARTPMRNGREIGNPGLNIDALSRLSFDVTYQPISDISLNFGYQYQNPYKVRSAYSMGSTLSEIESGGGFGRTYSSLTQQLHFGLKVPVTPDHRTFFTYTVSYDFYAGYAPDHRFGIVRQFHCWEVAAEYNYETKISGGDKEHESNFAVTARLLKLNGPLSAPSGGMLAAGQGLMP